MKKGFNIKSNLSKFSKFLIVYILVLLVISAFVLIRVNSLLRDFEASQPERIVEQQITLIRDAARAGELEKALPITGAADELLETDHYPDSFVECIANSDLTYEQKTGAFGANSTEYTVLADGKPVVDIGLTSTNERTQMIVFSTADWSLESKEAVVFEREFSLPSGIFLRINGNIVTGEEIDENGDNKYNIEYLGNTDVELLDTFGNSEKQYRTVRKNFGGARFTVPSNFEVTADGKEVSEVCKTSTAISEYEYVAKYTEMPTLVDYDISFIPREDGSRPVISIKDNLGDEVEYSYGEKLKVSKQSALPTVPEELMNQAGVLDFSKKWSLFMTNDLAGGLGSLSKYLFKDSYLYSVAYKWSIGIDRTFTSIHTLYNPPFKDEKVTNFVQYSDNCFSCDVRLVKKMRIANGLDVDDELSGKLFFVKYDNTKDGIDNPQWMVADMVGSDIDDNEELKDNGGDSIE